MTRHGNLDHGVFERRHVEGRTTRSDHGLDVAKVDLGFHFAPLDIALDYDADDDAIIDLVDNCPTVANTDQADCDRDLVGDVCDETLPDTDGDSVPDACDSCWSVPNTRQEPGGTSCPLGPFTQDPRCGKGCE